MRLSTIAIKVLSTTVACALGTIAGAHTCQGTDYCSTWADLTICVANPSYTTCNLAAGTIYMGGSMGGANDATITITHPVAVVGRGYGGAGSGGTTIQRGSGTNSSGKGAPFRFFFASGAVGVYGDGVGSPTYNPILLNNLQIDGNRYNINTDPNGNSVYCGSKTGSSGPCGCSSYYDVDFGQLNSTGSTGTAAIEYVSFINGPSDVLDLGGYGSVVQYSQFGSSIDTTKANHGTAIWLAGNYTNANYNVLYNAGSAAINSSGDNTIVYANNVYQSRYEDTSGGQVFTGAAHSYPSVAANYIDGQNYYIPTNGVVNGCSIGNSSPISFTGIESNGTGDRYYNNEVKNNLGGGMQFGQTAETEAGLLVSTVNPWNPGEPRRKIESNGSTGTTYGGQTWPANGLTFHACAIMTGISLELVSVLNNSAWGVWADSSTGSCTPEPAFVHFQSSSGGSTSACITGNGSLIGPVNGGGAPSPTYYAFNPSWGTFSTTTCP